MWFIYQYIIINNILQRKRERERNDKRYFTDKFFLSFYLFILDKDRFLLIWDLIYFKQYNNTNKIDYQWSESIVIVVICDVDKFGEKRIVVVDWIPCIQDWMYIIHTK